MALPQWSFWLANSNNLSLIAPLSSARNKSLSLALNRPGQLSFSLSMTDEVAEYISPLSTCILAYRTGSTGQLLVWSGYIQTVEEDITGNVMTVNAVGWLERLQKRFVRRKKVYTAQRDDQMVFDLLAEANLTTSPAPESAPIYIPSGSSPATPTWIQAGTLLPNNGPGGDILFQNGPAFNKTIEQYSIIGSEITSMNETENGCDIDITPDTRTLNIYRKKEKLRDSTVFGYNWGPNNIGQFSRSVDGTVVANYHVSTGRQGSIPGKSENVPSQTSYGIYEELTSLSDVAKIEVLQAYSAGEVLLRKHPRQIYNLTPFPYTEGGRVPEPFVGYEVGDRVRLTAKWTDRVDVEDLGIRVFGVSFNIDEEGNERPGPLQLAYGG